MDEIKARVIVSVLGSAATVLTLASVVGAGKKWATTNARWGSRRSLGGSPSASSRLGASGCTSGASSRSRP